MRRWFGYIILLMGLLTIQVSKAQQISEFSQYLNNPYLINSAATDISRQLNVDLSIRKQQSRAIKNISSYYASIYGTLKKPNPRQGMTNGFRERKYVSNTTLSIFNPKPTPIIGLIVAQDNFGVVERTNMHFTAGMHLPLNARYTLSTAASIGNILLNVSDRFTILEDNDIPFYQFIEGFDRRNILDLGLSMWLYSDQLQVGYSIQRLFSGNSVHYGNEETFKIRNFHVVSLGYKFQLNQDWQFIPSMIYRISSLEENKADISIRTVFRDKLWTSFSLRKESILVFNFGMKVSSNISVSYSYDHGSINEGRESLSANEIALKIAILPKSRKSLL
ncbi:MAG: PorP/SprF family type IX secretion system membrane protein [Cytophagia bacterium]|nr:PorP/SprF family type IX secretion system membrane protein [Cytophagia bacterium]